MHLQFKANPFGQMCGKACRLHFLIDAICPTDSERMLTCQNYVIHCDSGIRWIPVKFTPNWRFPHTYTYIHLIPLITSKQWNQVSFKPLSSTWPTYDTKSRSSTLSNAYILNTLPCSLDWRFWFQCIISYMRGLNLKTFWKKQKQL